MEVPLIIGGSLALVAGLIVLVVIADRKRTEGLSQTASEMGLQFEKNGEVETSEIRSRFELFSRGRSRRSKNLIYGEANGTGIWIFDYQYTTGSGKNSSTHRQTVICFGSTQLNLPQFNLYAEGMLSRLGSNLFGMQDIDFESHPEFSAKFVLKGESEVAVRERFHENLLSFFETQDKRLRVEGRVDLLLLYRASKTVKHTLLKEFLQESFVVFREFLPA